MSDRNFFAELKRRNVYKVAVAYAVAGWVIAQIATQIFPFLEIPNWIVRLVIVLIAIGFPIALIIAWAFEATPEGIKRTEVADSARDHSRGKAWIYVVIIGAVLSIGLFFLGRYSTSPLANKAAAAGSLSKSVVILPFMNLSRDPDNAYFAAGIQDEIVTRLARIAELRAVSCNSMERFKAAPDDLSAIAKQIGVAHVLKGNVQKSGDAVCVNVQLINAENEVPLWGETFDRQLTDVFQIESEIAKMIAEKLRAKLTGFEERAISVKPTQNSEAHELYLKGRYLWNRRTAENLKKALNYFQQAAEKDPTYTLAYAGIADTYSVMPAYGAGSPQECLPRAQAAAQRALKLDNTLAEPHASLGFILGLYFKLAESTKEFERAIELNPNYATAHQWYARVPLLMAGQVDRAIAESRRAVELDPVSPIIRSELGGAYMIARRYDEAIEELRSTLQIDPEFYWAHRYLGLVLELKGATEEALAEYQKAFELNEDPTVLALVAHAYANSGRPNEAREILARLSETAKSRYVPAYAFAVIHLALGEKDVALDWLEKNAREHGPPATNLIAVDPYLEPLRGEPRFEAIVSRILAGSRASDQP